MKVQFFSPTFLQYVATVLNWIHMDIFMNSLSSVFSWNISVIPRGEGAKDKQMGTIQEIGLIVQEKSQDGVWEMLIRKILLIVQTFCRP
jgi:hypothetical protein